MYSWLTFYHSGHEVAKDFRPHMTELQSRIQRVTFLSEILKAERTLVNDGKVPSNVCVYT